MPQEMLCKAPQQDIQAGSDSMLDVIAGANGIRITQCEDGGIVCEFETGGVISISPEGAIKRVSFANAPNLS